MVNRFLRALAISKLRILYVSGDCRVAGLHLFSELLVFPLHFLSAHHVVGLEVVGYCVLEGLNGPDGERAAEEAGEAERKLNKSH